MVATTRTTFDRQLNDLQSNVLHISDLVAGQIIDAIAALQNNDVEAAEHVSAFDKTINRLRYETEEQCYTLLALQQPNASDMRRIVATVSVVTNLERMGDHAAGIARLVVRMKEKPITLHIEEFNDMARIAAGNLRDAMNAMVMGDKVMARATVGRDAQIDQLHKTVYDRLISLMREKPECIERATMLLWVSHNLERYADRISNICERIIYVLTGELHEQRIDPMP